MTDEEAINNPCSSCGGKCHVICVGYSCPAIFKALCYECGKEEERLGEGVKVLSQIEAMNKRPQMFTDEQRREIVKDALRTTDGMILLLEGMRNVLKRGNIASVIADIETTVALLKENRQ